MKLKLILIPFLLLTGCASQDGTVFGRKADAGAVFGGMVGTMIGAYNGNPLKGALIGSAIGLGAGAVADNNDERQKTPPSYVAKQPPTREILPDVVVVDSIPPDAVPVVIEYRGWYGGYYRPIRVWGYRDHFGRIYRRR